MKLKKLAFESLYGGQFTLLTQLIKSNLISCNTPHRRSFFQSYPPYTKNTPEIQKQ